MQKEKLRFKIKELGGSLALERDPNFTSFEHFPVDESYIVNSSELFKKLFIELDCRTKPFTKEGKNLIFSNFAEAGLYMYVNTHIYNFKNINKFYDSEFDEVPHIDDVDYLINILWRANADMKVNYASNNTFKIQGTKLKNTVGCDLAVSYTTDYLAKMKECFDRYTVAEKRQLSMVGLSYNNVRKSTTFGFNYGLRRYPLIKETRELLYEVGEKCKMLFDNKKETFKFSRVTFILTYSRYRLKTVDFKLE